MTFLTKKNTVASLKFFLLCLPLAALSLRACAMPDSLPVQTKRILPVRIWKDVFPKWKITDRKIAAWGMCAVGGTAWGLHEAIYADPQALQNRYGFDPYSWGGEFDWQTKYPGGRYEEGEKPDWFRDKTNVFREAKKTTAFAGRYLVVGATVILCGDKSRRNWKDFALGALLYSGCASASYNFTRYGSIWGQ